MKIKNLLKNEYVFSVLNKFVSVMLSLVQSVLVARYLGAELQGISAYITGVVSVSSIVITFGMHQVYPYFRKNHNKKGFYNDYLSLICILYAIYLFLALIIASFSFIGRETKAIIVLTPVFGYSGVVAYTCLVEKPNIRNLWWTISSILEILFIILLWMFVERNFIWAVAIVMFVEVIKAIAYTIILKPQLRLHKGLGPLALELSKHGFFPMVALLMTNLNYRVDVLMLKQYSFITNSMIGVYAIGIQMAGRISMIPDTLRGVLISRLTRGRDEHEVANACRISFWASICICTVFLLMGRFVIGLLYGPEYHNAYYALLISSFGAVAIGYFKLIMQYNIINKRQILSVYMLCIAVVVDIVFNLLFIPLWGINGAAFATGLGNLACGVVFVAYFCKKTKIPVSEMIIPQKEDIQRIKALFKRK